jgi:hypothetical protein
MTKLNYEILLTNKSLNNYIDYYLTTSSYSNMLYIWSKHGDINCFSLEYDNFWEFFPKKILWTNLNYVFYGFNGQHFS